MEGSDVQEACRMHPGEILGAYTLETTLVFVGICGDLRLVRYTESSKHLERSYATCMRRVRG